MCCYNFQSIYPEKPDTVEDLQEWLTDRKERWKQERLRKKQQKKGGAGRGSNYRGSSNAVDFYQVVIVIVVITIITNSSSYFNMFCSIDYSRRS